MPKLRRTLDQQEPPEDEIIALGPGDSIGWNVVVQLDIAKADRKTSSAKPARAQ